MHMQHHVLKLVSNKANLLRLLQLPAGLRWCVFLAGMLILSLNQLNSLLSVELRQIYVTQP